MSTKQSLKQIQKQIKDGELEGALHNATTLLKGLKKDEPDAASVLCYRGLALSYLQRNEESEKCYVGAYKLKPDHPLASKALKQLYTKTEDWEKLGLFLERLVQEAYEAGDGEACASTLHELFQLRQAHGPLDRLYLALNLLLPSSPLLPLLSSLKPPSAQDATYVPFSQPTYPAASLFNTPSLPSPLPHPLYLQNSLALLLNLLIRQQSLIHTKIEKDVKDARSKIGAKSEKETRRAVEGKVLGGEMGGRLVELLREVAGHPDTEEGTRRGVEGEEFGYWRKLVGVLGDDTKPAKKSKATADPTPDSAFPPAPLFTPTPYTAPTKAEALSRVDSLASGFILLKLSHASAEGAYEWTLEGTDAKDVYYPLDLLHLYATKYPESAMGEFIDDYCRWFGLPPPPADEDSGEGRKVGGEGGGDGEGGKEGSTEDEKKKEKPKGKKYKKGKKGMNARERRKARRVAGQEGTLSEDVEAEERDELVADMTKMLDKLPRSIFAHRVMASISLQEDDLANAIAYAEKGRLLLKELQSERGVSLPETSASLDTVLGVALVPYYAPKHHTRATRLLNGAIAFDANNNQARFARAQIYQHAGEWAKARDTFQQVLDLQPDEKLEMSSTEEVGWCLVNEGNLERGRDVLEEVAQRRTNAWIERGEKEGDDALGRARVWYRLGRTEWMIDTEESKSQAEEWYTTSLRSLPTYAPSYTALGLVFAGARDEERAQKCFQKAFELDATEADAAERLARGYANEDEWALVRAIATRVMEGEGGVEGVQGGDAMGGKGRFAPKNGWAWKALGSTEMYYRNFVKASQSYQIALRALPDDIPTHVLLAEAYIKSGKHIAALKTLNHVLTLDPEHWIAKYDIALIHVELGHFSDAIAIYKQLDAAKPAEVGILASLAGAWLSQGREMLNGGFRQRAKDAFVEASRKAQEVIALDRQYRTWGWKVVADAAFEMSGLGLEEEDLEVLVAASVILTEQDEDKRAAIAGVKSLADAQAAGSSSREDSDGTSALPLRLAVTAFTWRAYLLRDERALVVMSALYDQAAALHMLVRATTDEEEKMAAAKAAIAALRRALEKDSSDERLWNALGVLCGEAGKAVAQHAFVVSLDLYTKDPITWANLGYLYLQLDDRELANQCFLKSQTLDPDYASAWLGQGFLALRDGERVQASSLFAHAVTLAAGGLLEADLAAAAMLYERYMVPGHYDVGELHQPAFALKRYIHRRPRDSAAIHLYGLLSEKLGMVDEAESAFETSVALLEDEFEKTESEAIEQRYAMALANLGRVRLASGAYERAVEAYSSCWDLIQGDAADGQNSNGVGKEGKVTGFGIGQTATLKTQVKLGTAIAKHWTGDVDACLEEFENALEEAEASHVEGLKDSVVVLLARTLWSLGEEGKEVAKGHLMECLSSESPDINVISALGAVALATSDSDLLDAVSSELSNLPEHARFSDLLDLAGLVLCTASLVSEDENDGVDTALSDLAAALQTAPWNTTIRARLARLYMASGKPQEARDVLLMDTRDTEPELVALRGVARVQMGERAGLSEVMRSVRAKPWDEAKWEGLGWGVGAVGGLEDEVFEAEQEGTETPVSTV